MKHLTPSSRFMWLLTVAVLVAAIGVLPRFSSEPGEDVHVSRIKIGERAQIKGGTVKVTGVSASPEYLKGGEAHRLKDGYFIEVRASIRPEKTASSVSMSIESDGRSFDTSDLSPFVVKGEPGFSTPVSLLFEVPKDVVGNGRVVLRFQSHSSVAVGLTDGNVKRVKQLEESR